MTTPPLLSVLAALFAVVRRTGLCVWVMDLNPDELIAAGWQPESNLLQSSHYRLATPPVATAAATRVEGYWRGVLKRLMRDKVAIACALLYSGRSEKPVHECSTVCPRKTER